LNASEIPRSTISPICNSLKPQIIKLCRWDVLKISFTKVVNHVLTDPEMTSIPAVHPSL
jgi:hypothetical protein